MHCLENSVWNRLWTYRNTDHPVAPACTHLPTTWFRTEQQATSTSIVSLTCIMESPTHLRLDTISHRDVTPFSVEINSEFSPQPANSVWRLSATEIETLVDFLTV